MKLWYLSALLLGSVACALANDEAETGPRILVSKQLLNKYFVQDMDLIVRYTLYNIGGNSAYNVVISDASFSPEVFTVVGGQLNSVIPRIPPGANVTHIVVLRPIRVGPYNFSAAEVSYKTSEETDTVQTVISSEPGEGYIVAFRDYDKKFSPHLLDWSAFAVMTLPSLAIPFLLWWKSKSKYENLARTKKSLKE